MLQKKQILTTLAITILFTFLSIMSISVDASEDTTFTIGLEMVDIPDDIFEYVQEKAAFIVEDSLKDSDFFHMPDFSLDSMLVLNPFVMYEKTIDTYTSNLISDIYYFAVVSNNRVLCVISVSSDEDRCSYSVTGSMNEMLDAFIGESTLHRIYVYDPDDGTAPQKEIVSMDSLPQTQTLYENQENESVFLDLSNKIDENNIRLINSPTSDSINQLSTISYPTQGFSIDTAGYKRLDMTNCLVSQGPYLCAIPCIATIYRYRTATHTMDDSLLTQINNGRYDVTTTVGQVNLLNYIMPTTQANQYEVNTQLVNQFLVQHNINNKFPIILGATRTKSDGSKSTHAFVIQGYQLDADKMKLYLFNPWGDDFSTDYFPNNATYVFKSTYTWTQSGNSCLLLP